MTKELIEKPIIIAICGKSAVGKDTLANFLTDTFSSYNLKAHNMISVTTRPRRKNEQDKKDYYFINEQQFQYLVDNQKLIEHTHFRSWKYGVPFNEIKKGEINIGVFNLEGLDSLQRNKYEYTVIPVYLKEKLTVRLRRSRDREGRWRIEHFRRAFSDWIDFYKAEKRYLSKLNNGRYIVLKQVNGVWRQSNQIITYLERWGILKRVGKKEMRLGNFV